MAMASGIFGLTLRDVLDTSGVNVDLIGAGIKMQLVTDTYTPDFNVHDTETDITNEISGTGYTAGGKAITSPTLVASAGVLTWDAADTSWTSATFSAVRGRVLFDDTPTTPVADPLICATTFGSDYAVTSGTFTVQENASGILTIDYTP